MRYLDSKKCTAFLFFTVLLLTALVCRPAGAVEESKAATAFAAPDFDLQDLQGSHVTLSQFKGQKPVLLYFWATWCPHCMAVRPDVIKLRKTTSNDDVEIIAINVGQGDSLAKVKRFEEADPAPYTVLYDTGTKVTRSYQVEGVPHFILLDKTGVVKYNGSELPSNPMALLKQ
jgi:peroxiredoxin